MSSELKQYEETLNLLLYSEETKEGTAFYRKHKKNDPEPVKTHIITSAGVHCFCELGVVKEIFLKGYSDVPEILSPYGYGFKTNELNYFLRSKIKEKINRIEITKSAKTRQKKECLILNVKELEGLIRQVNQERYASSQIKNALISNFISEKFPSLGLGYKENNNSKDLILRNLNSSLVSNLTEEDIEKFGAFYVEASKKFKRPDVVKRVLKGLEKKAKAISLQQIILLYEKLLRENPKEAEWQKLFNDYITIFDSRYIKRLDLRNISLGTTKYPDLLLVDIYGYVDFYELKKSSMKLLEYDKSHKTYYWSKESSKVIAQVVDYLQGAKDNAVALVKKIQEETATEGENGIKTTIVRPRGVIVAGSRSLLKGDKMNNQFKALRGELKDIEFVLYDELLERLRNLFSQIQGGI